MVLTGESVEYLRNCTDRKKVMRQKIVFMRN